MCVVLQFVALRAGARTAEIANSFKGLVELWEVELCVGWLVEVGALGRTLGGGLVAREGWWSGLGDGKGSEGERSGGVAGGGAVGSAGADGRVGRSVSRGAGDGPGDGPSEPGGAGGAGLAEFGGGSYGEVQVEG